MDALAQELRLAWRQLIKTPRFTLTVVVTLAFGIGGTVAVFSLVEGILLRPLPFDRPRELVLLGDHLGDRPSISVTAREIGAYARASEAFSEMGGYIDNGYEVSGGEVPEQLNGARFTAGVFSALGVSPILGRAFTQKEEDAAEPVALISYGLWLTRYQRDPHIIGRLIVLDRKAHSIIGVMPRSFAFPPADGTLDQAQVWVPMSLTSAELSDEHAGFWGYHLIARVKDGVSLSQAARDADRVAQQIMHDLPPAQSKIHIRGDVAPLLEYEVSEVRPLLRELFLAASIVLLITCANVAGLLLLRTIRRRREYAVRLALGARSGAIIRQSLGEGLVLGVTGGLLGLAMAGAAIGMGLRTLPDSMPRVESIAMDGTVVGFAFVLALATGALCSVAPALAALKSDPMESLKEGNRNNTGDSSRAWFRSGLVVAEIAVALVLLIASTALLRSVQKMHAVSLGFRPDHVLVAGYQLPLSQYPTSASAERFIRELLSRLSNKPGIVAVAMSNAAPATGGYPKTAYTVEGRPTDRWKPEFAIFSVISEDYFRVMDIPLLEGRYFNTDDRSGSDPVVAVNESMAKHCWPGQQAVGKRMHVGGPAMKKPWATVVGVVADTKMGARDEPTEDQWYTPMEQADDLYFSGDSGKLTDAAGGYVSVRSVLPPEQIVHTVRTTVAEIDPMLALQQMQPMTEAIANVEAPRRFNAGLISVFALGALLLAVMGIYAVVAFSASLRTHEMAIRMALGAQRQRITRLVLFSAVRLATLGCALGVIGSLAAARVTESLLFEVSATDPRIYVASVMVMMGAALLAAGLPARRMASLDPIVSLRSM